MDSKNSNQNSVVYGDSDDLLVFCQNFSNNENMKGLWEVVKSFIIFKLLTLRSGFLHF